MRRLPAILAVAGGLLLLYAGLSGNVGFWTVIEELVTPHVEDPARRAAISLAIRIVIVLSSLGGISVILGGVLIWKDRTLIGQLLVFLGAATGVLGLLLGIGLTVAQGGSYLDYFSDRLNGAAGTLGVLLSWVARKLV